MSEHKVFLNWHKQTDSFAYRDYNREHKWVFENGTIVQASAAPKFLGKEDCVDPEEAFVASLSSCHMLTFLAICARKNIIVEKYEDHAVGFLEPNKHKKLVVTRVILKPQITFASGHKPTEEELDQLHEQSHHGCFLANSVKTEISVE